MRIKLGGRGSANRLYDFYDAFKVFDILAVIPVSFSTKEGENADGGHKTDQCLLPILKLCY